LRDTSVVAGLVAVAAFCQTHPKPKSLGLRKHRVLRRRARHHGRRHHPKHQKRKRYFAKIWHCGCSLQSEFHPWRMAGVVIPGLTRHGNVEKPGRMVSRDRGSVSRSVDIIARSPWRGALATKKSSSCLLLLDCFASARNDDLNDRVTPRRDRPRKRVASIRLDRQ
jgi:hypothetical protein